MRKITVRQFRANMATELGELPFLIERRGEVIAEVNVYTPEPSVHKGDITFKDLRDKPMSPEWKEIKTKEDVAKKIEIVGGYEVPKPFKMPHYFGGKQK